MIAPSYHIDHPYRDEIESLEYRPWQLDVSDVAPKTPEQIALHNNDDAGEGPGNDDDDGGDDDDGAVWISTEDDLAALVERIYDSEGGGGGCLCGRSRWTSRLTPIDPTLDLCA